MPLNEVTERKLHVMHFAPNECVLLLRPVEGVTTPDLQRTQSAIREQFKDLPFNSVRFRQAVSLPGTKVLQVIELPRFREVLNLKASGATVDQLSGEIGTGIDEVLAWVGQMNSIIAPMRWADDPVAKKPSMEAEMSRRGATYQGSEGQGAVEQDAPYQVGDYYLEAVSPNWHAGALCGGAGCCGPASAPTPAVLAVNGEVHFSRADVLRVKHDILEVNNLPPNGLSRGDGIRVAVIDTFPMEPGNLRLSEITKLAKAFPANPRLKQWLTAPFLQEADVHDYVVPGYPISASLHLDCYGKFEEPYDESDHGFFIADVINDIAPCAHISIYRVAEDHGCCTLESVGKAVADAVQEAEEADENLIINMSLGFVPTVAMLPDEYANARMHFDDSRRFGLDCRGMHSMPRNNNAETAARNSMVMMAIEEMFNLTGNEHVLVVAAAGNDSCRDLQSIAASPRWPAIIEGILGVASMDSDWAMSEFSNTDDFNVPPAEPDGFTAFGGGVVGLFTKHPDDTPWQTWAGTSFSTPVASGIAACLWSDGISKADVRDCLLSFPNDKLPLFQSPRDASEVDGWHRTC